MARVTIVITGVVVVLPMTDYVFAITAIVIFVTTYMYYTVCDIIVPIAAANLLGFDRGQFGNLIG